MLLQFWRSTGPFGSSWSVLGAPWAQLGRLLDSRWTPTWSLLGSTCAHFGPTWTLLGPTWTLSGPTWGKLGRSCAQLGRSPWPLERLSVPCTPICAVRPDLLLTCELPFELTQQLPVRMKLHLNFHNSCRFQQYIVASALHCRWISTGAG